MNKAKLIADLHRLADDGHDAMEELSHAVENAEKGQIANAALDAIKVVQDMNKIVFDVMHVAEDL